MDLDCGLLIKNIDNSLIKMANESLAEDDITFSQLRIMAYMYENEGHKAHMKDMERFYDVSQPTITGIIKRLEQKGLVEFEPDEHDHRVKIAVLTDLGVEVTERQENFRSGIQKVLLSPLDKRERQQFMDMLEKIWASMRKDGGIER